jgi:hypothetical protein
VRASRLVAAAASFWVAAFLAAQAAPAPTAPPNPAPKAARVPLDFNGVWELDAKESKSVSKNMEKAVISIRQSGDRIWIEPIEQRRPWLVADEIVVDGKVYEKAIGGGKKGSVQAQWGKDDRGHRRQARLGLDASRLGTEGRREDLDAAHVELFEGREARVVAGVPEERGEEAVGPSLITCHSELRCHPEQACHPERSEGSRTRHAAEAIKPGIPRRAAPRDDRGRLPG